MNINQHSINIDEDKQKLLNAWIELDTKLVRGEFKKVHQMFGDSWSYKTFVQNLSRLRKIGIYSSVSSEQLELLIQCAKIVVSSRTKSKAKLRLEELKSQYAI